MTRGNMKKFEAGLLSGLCHLVMRFSECESMNAAHLYAICRKLKKLRGQEDAHDFSLFLFTELQALRGDMYVGEMASYQTTIGL